MLATASCSYQSTCSHQGSVLSGPLRSKIRLEACKTPLPDDGIMMRYCTTMPAQRWGAKSQEARASPMGLLWTALQVRTPLYRPNRVKPRGRPGIRLVWRVSGFMV